MSSLPKRPSAVTVLVLFSSALSGCHDLAALRARADATGFAIDGANDEDRGTADASETAVLLDAAVENAFDEPLQDATIDEALRSETGAETTDETSIEASSETGSDASVERIEPRDVAVGECIPGAVRACYTGTMETRRRGRCRSGVQYCTQEATWSSACLGQLLPATMELCNNGLDDDCDGMLDEGCPPACAEPRMCNTANAAQVGVGACVTSPQMCSSATTPPSYEPCRNPGPTTIERCGNSVDDNCNGMVDEGCTGVSTTASYEVGPVAPETFIELCDSEFPHTPVMFDTAPITDNDDDAVLIPSAAGMIANTIPFPIRAFGRLLPPVFTVSTNGWLSLSADFAFPNQSDLSGRTSGLDDPEVPGILVAPLWADLEVPPRGICYAVVGTAPNRKFVVEWLHANSIFASDDFVFEVVISEAPAGQDNLIEVIYRTVRLDADSPVEYTAGILNADGRSVRFDTGSPYRRGVRLTPTR